MIHKYTLGGLHIVLDINSGSAHIVDKTVYDLLDTLDPDNIPAEHPDENIASAYREIAELVSRGLLFSDYDYEQHLHKLADSPIKAMCLNISHDCNLRCRYCFAGTGNFGGDRENMSAETGKRAIDFLIEKSGGRRNLEVDFFGGEPLLNFETVKSVVEYARSKESEYGKNFRFTITTNGLLLDDDIINYINKEMSNVVLSLDGRKSVNDFMRGNGCYDAVVDNYRKLVAGRGRGAYFIRGTFTKHNLDFAEDVLHIHSLEFDDISIEPVVSDPTLDYSVTEDDLPVIFEEYERLAEIIAKNRKNGGNLIFFHFMINLNHGPCAIKRIKGCGCGAEYIAVTPDGSIYPCHQFVGNEAYRLGNLSRDTAPVDEGVRAQFKDAGIYSKEECKQCFAKFYCSGGCIANNLNYGGSLHATHELSCKLTRKRVETGIMLNAKLALDK